MTLYYAAKFWRVSGPLSRSIFYFVVCFKVKKFSILPMKSSQPKHDLTCLFKEDGLLHVSERLAWTVKFVLKS